jgi:hypothetical protein
MRTSVIFGYFLLFVFATIMAQITFFPGFGGATIEQEFNAMALGTLCAFIGALSLLYAKRKYGAATLK